MFDLNHFVTVAGTWIAAHMSAPSVQVVIDKVRGKTNGSRNVGKITVAEFKETLRNTVGEVVATQTKILGAIAKTNETISTNTAILVDRSR